MVQVATLGHLVQKQGQFRAVCRTGTEQFLVHRRRARLRRWCSLLSGTERALRGVGSGKAVQTQTDEDGSQDFRQEAHVSALLSVETKPQVSA